MKIILTLTGKTVEKYLTEGISIYEKRINNYLPFEIQTLPELKFSKNTNINIIKNKEAEVFLKTFGSKDIIVLLDENGKEMNSAGFAGFVSNNMLNSTKVLRFVIGGAYGFTDAVRERANYIIGLSLMTFSHQLVRLIFVEQLYRAMTIIKGEPYHHS
ncbi:MAG: 23S rRNA (pseudouridine(1915)-N(3))-methyltransferase RlmH [Bacteroidota bacterium]|nr:23S rRNA (pseudouridine(1915)-N(3))-methyltransferase RlmH [Bacteroidota bacterium]